jgi:hypothetical protein
VAESWDDQTTTYTLPQWKSAKTDSGNPRNLDPNGTIVSLSGFTSYRISGSNKIPNGDLSAGLSSWHSWNEVSPLGTLAMENCGGSVGQCLRYTVGASWGIVYSHNFATVKNQWYRVSFDLRVSRPSQLTRVVVRRGGGGDNSYEFLMPAEQRIFGTTSFKRYSFVFQANRTINVNDPVTQDAGARLDFRSESTGDKMWIANVEMVPITSVSSSLSTKIILNPTFEPKLVSCSEVGIEPEFCGKYVRFVDATPVTWPHSIGALRGEVIYSRENTLVDTDGDGITDSQDICPATPSGSQVNSKGCALGQS